MTPHIKHIKDMTQIIRTHLFLYIANMTYYQIPLSKCISLKNNENYLLKL